MIVSALAATFSGFVAGLEGPNLYLSHALERARAATGVPGMSAVLVQNGRTVAVGASGFRKYGTPGNVRVTDAFRVGSVSKPITGYLAGVALPLKGVSWNNTMQSVYPTMVTWPGVRRQYLQATVAHLMKHESGMPYRPGNDPGSCFLSPSAPTPKDRRMAYTKSAVRDIPKNGLGAATVYGGGSIIVAGMMEQKFNRAFPELLQIHLFGPLGITSGGVGKPPAIWEHVWESNKPKPHWVDDAHTLVHAPAGAIYLNAEDLGKFISATLYDAQHGKRLLSKPKLQTMFAPDSHNATPSGFFASGSNYGVPGKPALAHDGDNGGQYSRIHTSPPENYGYGIMANMAGDRGVQAVNLANSEIVALNKKMTAANNYHRSLLGYKSISASANFNDDHRAPKAMDGSFLTRWAAPAGVTTATLTVQPLTPTTITGAMVDEEYGRIKKFAIEYRNSATDSWKTLATVHGCGPQKLVIFPPTLVVYVRLNVLEATDGPSIWEFHLYKA